MRRNEFLKTCGSLCLSTSSVALLLQSCGSIHYATHTIDGNVIKINQSEFVIARNKQNGGHTFIIVKDPNIPFPICIYKNSDVVTALLMQCTHQGCEVNPNAYSLVCPCHGSEFDTNGAVINPPAEDPLTSYLVTTDSDNYYIHLDKRK